MKHSLAAAILEGPGDELADAYKPWNEIARRTSSPYSGMSVVPVPHLTRLTHYLSRGERELALFMSWLGATNVREQYPLWPRKHLYPAMHLGEATEARYHLSRIPARSLGTHAFRGIAAFRYRSRSHDVAHPGWST